MKVIVDEKKIDELLTRSVGEIIPSKAALKQLMMSGKRLRIYIGTDATGPALHLGHATNYLILEKFRQLGHQVIFLIGDFTARIGDPSDKTATRVQLTRDQVIKNTQTWLSQLKPIIDVANKENPVKIAYNHDWLAKLTFEQIIDLASNFTVQRMLERDMFQKRLKENKPIYVHEFFYPLMQGYDSVHMDIDIEMCGRDQKFNALAGRTLLRKYKGKEKFVFITTLLENPITGEKMMSKSQGTGIFLDISAQEMVGKVMAQPDENIPQLFVDCTRLDLAEIDKIKKQLGQKIVNPKEIKQRLAYEIARIYHGNTAARAAVTEFDRVFSKKEKPAEMPEMAMAPGEWPVLDVLSQAKLISSKAAGRRLIEQGGVKVDDRVVKEWREKIAIRSGMIIQAGKRKFVRVK